jgi:hypothetical protein
VRPRRPHVRLISDQCFQLLGLCCGL